MTLLYRSVLGYSNSQVHSHQNLQIHLISPLHSYAPRRTLFSPYLIKFLVIIPVLPLYILQYFSLHRHIFME